jgi:hypothetical protein
MCQWGWGYSSVVQHLPSLKSPWVPSPGSHTHTHTHTHILLYVHYSSIKFVFTFVITFGIEDGTQDLKYAKQAVPLATPQA